MDGFYVPDDFWMGTFFIFLPIFGVNQILFFFSAENYGKKGSCVRGENMGAKKGGELRMP